MIPRHRLATDVLPPGHTALRAPAVVVEALAVCLGPGVVLRDAIVHRVEAQRAEQITA